MSYGRSTTLRNPFGPVYGSTYSRLGQPPLHTLFDQTVVTPAERVGQYATLGAIGGLAVSALLLLGLGTVSKKKRLSVLGLITIPAAAAAGGVLLASAEYQS